MFYLHVPVHVLQKAMGYCSTARVFSFFKMLITQKVLVGISSNFLHSIRASICIRKCNKNWG